MYYEKTRSCCCCCIIQLVVVVDVVVVHVVVVIVDLTCVFCSSSSCDQFYVYYNFGTEPSNYIC